MPITYNETGVTYDSTSYTWEGERYQPSVFPVAGIFVAWDDGPYVANPTWTEVTTDVRAFQTHRGRGSDFDQFDTGTAQITFDNRTRKYDPFYTSGTYYGKLLPRRQVKIVAQIGGVTYDVYRGFIAGWPVAWSEYGKDSTVTVQCFDAIGLMVNEQVPTDWPAHYTSTTNPRFWYRFNDVQGGETITEYYGGPSLSVPSAYIGLLPYYFVSPPLARGYNYDALFCPFYGSGAVTIPEKGARDYTVAGWVQFVAPTDSNSFTGGVSVQFAQRSILFEFFYENQTRAGLSYQQNRIYVTTNGLTGSVNTFNRYALTVSGSTSQPIHYAVTYVASTNTTTIYVNGINVTSTRTTFGNGIITDDRLIVSIFNAALQDLLIYDRVISTTEITNLYNYGRASLEETTSARMDRILGTTSWPAALESFPAAPVGTVAEIGSGTGVIQELQLVADSEGGELYASKAGVLTMTARRDVFNAVRSKFVQAVITDTAGPSEAGIRYGSEIEIAYDADNLKNDVTVNYSGDGEVFQTNAVTIAAYGAAATTIETQLDSPTSAADLATLELGVEGVLVPQLSTIDVSSNTQAIDWQAILSLELLDRVNFRRTPAVGNQFNRNALINAIDHQVEPGQWRTQLTLSMRYTSPLTLDDSVLGKLDYNYLG